MSNQIESPFFLKISFNKLLERYEDLVDGTDLLISENAKKIINISKSNPELRDGFSDLSLLESYRDQIHAILKDSFSPILTKNEIKIASVPFQNVVFNTSERFKNIIKVAGDDFELKIKSMSQEDTYINACAVILDYCYGYKLNIKRPYYYEIPDENGIKRFYKILYNADFCEIIPTVNAPKITNHDFELLLDNFENIELWKDKFPPNSYVFKGFVISNIFDITDDQSISNIKSNLISDASSNRKNFANQFEEVFKSLFGINDLRIGFTTYIQEDNNFEQAYDRGMPSFLLNGSDKIISKDLFCKWSFNRLMNERNFISISNIDKAFKTSNGQKPHVKALYEQGFKSTILAPVAKDEDFLGILEIASLKSLALNSISAIKLIDVMPSIISEVERSRKEERNLIEAIIQKECTSIHQSVHWRFKREARNYIRAEQRGEETIFNKIAFDKIYPLYGQIDIKGSSEARNDATKKDLKLQLNTVKCVFENSSINNSLPIYEQFKYQINAYLDDLDTHFQVDSEQQISEFLEREIEPALQHLNAQNILKEEIHNYFESVNDKVKTLYHYRREYDETIAKINIEMAKILDKKQIDAQRMYPHFFERFKTDGVEHNMYIGESITKEDSFNLIYLYNLRLWQLQVMCEMENAYYQMRSNFPIQLDVTSLILVFNQPLSISFRMDEKQFDVDGTYNARYEIVKKRVDKAYIKGTNKRITEKGKITLVYSQKQDEMEYLRYIKFLQSKYYLDTDIEIIELQDLQAVTGLKAIRVSILYNKDIADKAYYTYEDLVKEIKD